jgi:hypothetical protein
MICLHRPRPPLIRGAIAMNPICVGDVKCLLIRRETNPIRTPEPIRHYPHISRHRIETIDVRAKLGFGSETLLEAVDGVCEPDATVGVQDDVVGGVKLPAVEVVEEGVSFVGRGRGHVD